MGMKKVGALVVAGALLTMGGVYATWTFSEKQTTGMQAVLSFGTKLGSVSGEKGVYSIDDTDGTFFAVSQLSSDFVQQNWPAELGAIPTGDTHQAVLMPNAAAKVVLTFTPDKNTDEVTRTEGIKTSWTYSLVHADTKYTINTADGKYQAGGTPTDIFALSNPDEENGTKQTITILPWSEAGAAEGEIRWTRSGNETDGYVFTYEMDATHIAKYHVKLARDFIVDTKAAYDVFSIVVGKCKVQVDVAEIVG